MSFTVDLSKLPAGIYLASAVTDRGAIAGYTKLIKN